MRGSDQQSHIRAAQTAFRSGKSAEALKLLLPLQDSNKDNIQFHMLLGMVARAEKKYDVAINAFGCARNLSPNDPEIANIEANAMDDAGHKAESLTAFNRLLGKHPNFVDGHINRAIVAQKVDLNLSINLAKESLRIHPKNARLWSILGSSQKNIEEYHEAISSFESSIELDSNRALTWFNRGVAKRAIGSHEDAWQDFEKAKQLGASGPQFDLVCGATLMDLGKVESAESLLNKAYLAGDIEAGFALARLRKEYLIGDDPFDHFYQNLSNKPDHKLQWMALLSGLLNFGDYKKLCEMGRIAIQAFPEDEALAINAAIGEAWEGNSERGSERLEAILSQSTNDAHIKKTLAEIYLSKQQPDRAEKYLREVIAEDEYDQAAWALLSTAWRMQGDEREYWLCDYDRLIMSCELENKDAAQTATEYAAYLADILDGFHVTRGEPGNQSLRHGTQTSGALFNRSSTQISALRDSISEAIKSEIKKLPIEEGHPFLSRKSLNLSFSGSWSVRLSGHGNGHHVSHCHSEGWLSSAYYARLPGNIGQDENDTSGWLHFGSPPERLGLDLPPRRVIKPEAGRLVLFPSYLWHGTKPFSGNDDRLSVAFDVVPDAP